MDGDRLFISLIISVTIFLAMWTVLLGGPMVIDYAIQNPKQMSLAIILISTFILIYFAVYNSKWMENALF